MCRESSRCDLCCLISSSEFDKKSRFLVLTEKIVDSGNVIAQEKRFRGPLDNLHFELLQLHINILKAHSRT